MCIQPDCPEQLREMEKEKKKGISLRNSGFASVAGGAGTATSAYVCLLDCAVGWLEKWVLTVVCFCVLPERNWDSMYALVLKAGFLLGRAGVLPH